MLLRQSVSNFQNPHCIGFQIANLKTSDRKTSCKKAPFLANAAKIAIGNQTMETQLVTEYPIATEPSNDNLVMPLRKPILLRQRGEITIPRRARSIFRCDVGDQLVIARDENCIYLTRDCPDHLEYLCHMPIRTNFQLTLHRIIRLQLNIAPGDLLQVVVSPNHICLSPRRSFVSVERMNGAASVLAIDFRSDLSKLIKPKRMRNQ